MAKKYGAEFRKDPNPALESLVAPPIRQTTQQRVLETADAAANIICSAYFTTNPTITDGVPANVSWTAEIIDTDTMHDNAVNNERIVVPATKPGTYRIMARVAIDVNAGNLTQFELRVLVNGTEVADEFTGALTADGVLMITHEQFMNGSDYFTIQVSSTGANCDLIAGASNSYVVVNKQSI